MEKKLKTSYLALLRAIPCFEWSWLPPSVLASVGLGGRRHLRALLPHHASDTFFLPMGFSKGLILEVFSIACSMFSPFLCLQEPHRRGSISRLNATSPSLSHATTLTSMAPLCYGPCSRLDATFVVAVLRPASTFLGLASTLLFDRV